MKVVCWKWKPVEGYRSEFGAQQVNRFASMVQRHFHIPHEILCITDDPRGITSDVRTIDIREVEGEFGKIPSPHGGVNPSCYRRLPMYSERAREFIGERFVSVDLDVVFVDDVTPVWNRPDADFMIWGETLRRTPYNGSMQMMTAGARRQVYDDFDPETSPMEARRAGLDGSDQAWISYKLGPLEKRWTMEDGVYSYRLHVKTNGGRLPKGARIVFFEGQVDPWTITARRMCPWIEKHWR